MRAWPTPRRVFDVLRAATQQRPGLDGAEPSSLGEVLARVISTLDTSGTHDDLAQLAVQVWAEATINPAVSEGMTTLMGRCCLRPDPSGVDDHTAPTCARAQLGTVGVVAAVSEGPALHSAVEAARRARRPTGQLAERAVQ